MVLCKILVNKEEKLLLALPNFTVEKYERKLRILKLSEVNCFRFLSCNLAGAKSLFAIYTISYLQFESISCLVL